MYIITATNKNNIISKFKNDLTARFRNDVIATSKITSLQH